jgi:hypothetical protein
MNQIFSRLGLTAVAIVAGAGTLAHAQTATTGAIAGVVTDKKGTPISGAQVTLSSAQIQRTVVTGADGSYRLGLLNPGNWQVKVVKEGYQLANGTVTIFSQQTQTDNFKMASTAAATVEVVAAEAAVDYTTTSIGQNLSMDQIASIPKGRDFTSMAMLTPGVVDNGNVAFNANSPSMSGASAAENSYVLDGLDTTDYRRGYQGAALKTDFIDQVSVQTGGFSPEFSALGGVFNAITKSGSNDFKGSTWATWDAIGIQAVAKKTKYGRQAAANSRYDIGAEFGGPIIKDKLFFFVGVDGDFTESPTPTANNNGLVGSKYKNDASQFLSKINWFINQDMQLTYFLNYNSTKATQDIAYPLNGTANYGEEDKSTVLNTTLNFDWNITPALVFSAKAGYTDNKQTQNPSNTTDSRVQDYNWFVDGPGTLPGGNPAGVKAGTGFNQGGYGIYDPLDENKTTQFKADLSWFVSNHALKFGVGYLDSKYAAQQATSGGAYIGLLLDYAGYNFKILETTNAEVENKLTSYYAQDNWEMFSGFHLLYGFRFEKQEQLDFRGQTFMKFDSFSDQVQPRLGFTWDPENNGLTKVSGSYATYYERIPQRLAIRVFANEVYTEQDYYGPGNTTYNPATGAYTFSGAPDGVVDYATPFSFDPIAENIKLPKRTEYTLGVDHTFPSGWTLGIHGTHRELSNAIEDSVILRPWGGAGAPALGVTPTAGSNYRAPYDPGAPVVPGSVFSGTWGTPWLYDNFAGQAILWNPGSNVAWTARGISGTPNQHYVVGNTGFDPAWNQYDSVTLSMDKHTDRDYISANYTWSRLQGNYEGLVSSSNGQADANITASFDYAPYMGTGLLPLDRTHVVKVQYSHRFTVHDGDLNVGFNYTYQSGTPLSMWEDGRYTAAALGQPLVKGTSSNGMNGNWGKGNLEFDPGGYGNATPFMGQLGNNGRTPSLNNVDTHVDYVYKIGTKYRIMPSVDIFNTFNTRYATRIDDQAITRSGTVNTAYMQATGWQTGRRYRFGVKFQF